MIEILRCSIRKRAATSPPKSVRSSSRCCTSCACASSRRPAAASGSLNLKVTLLGSGTSHGVPMIGCDCAVCRSTDPRDRRLRPSIRIEIDGAAPAFARGVSAAFSSTPRPTSATQALSHDIRRVDAILFTHSHADHVMGLDDVRRFNVMQKDAIPCLRRRADARRSRADVQLHVRRDGAAGGGIPRLTLFTIGGPFSLGGVEVIPVPVLHGRRMILGYRIGAFAYLTDCSAIPEASWPLLTGRTHARARRAARPSASDAFQCGRARSRSSRA